jgi:uncharacterized protein
VGVVAVAAALPWGCALPGGLGGGPVRFDTAQVWIHDGTDSVGLLVEVAETDSQREVGLRDRSSLDPGSGMIFLLDSSRDGDEGFWMWRTAIPLDIAFLDEEGRIVAVLSMDPCLETDPELCPEYVPGVAYRSALEVNQGWFQEHGVAVGHRLRLVR